MKTYTANTDIIQIWIDVNAEAVKEVSSNHNVTINIEWDAKTINGDSDLWEEYITVMERMAKNVKFNLPENWHARAWIGNSDELWVEVWQGEADGIEAREGTLQSLINAIEDAKE